MRKTKAAIGCGAGRTGLASAAGESAAKGVAIRGSSERSVCAKDGAIPQTPAVCKGSSVTTRRALPVVTSETFRDLLPDLAALNGFATGRIEGFTIDSAGTGWLFSDNEGVAHNSGETVFWSIGPVN